MKLTNNLDADNNKITNLTDPTSDQDAATKAFSKNASNISTGTLASARLSSTVGTILGLVYNVVTVNASSTVYGALMAITSLVAGENNRAFIMPVACAIKSLYLYVSGSQPASGSLVVTVRKNLAATAITFTIPASGAATSYSDTAHTVSFAAGDTIDVQFVNNATAASINLLSVSVLIIPG